MLHEELKALCGDKKLGCDVTGVESKGRASEFVAAAVKLAPKDYDISKLGVDLEIALRQQLSVMIDSGRTQELINQGLDSSMFKLINFAIEIALVTDESGIRPVNNVKKIPFLMLEDVFTAQTFMVLPAVWSSLLIPLAPVLTSEVLFPLGKNILLRMCNLLLKRLSPTCSPELVGSIKMFLASAFPINDPSAVNMARRHNVTSTVKYVDESDNYAATIATKEESMDISSQTENGDEENELSSQATEGPQWTFRMLPKDLAPAVQHEHNRTYEEYTNFWGLQAMLAAEPRALNNDPTQLLASCKKALTLLEACRPAPVDVEVDERKFLSEMSNAVLTKPPAQKVSDASTVSDVLSMKVEKPQKDKIKKATTISPSTAVEPSSEPSQEYLGVRYLTAPELLPLQLRSHPFRQQLCVQILISCQSLRAHYREKAVEYVPTPSDLAAAKTDKLDADTTAKPNMHNPRAMEIWLATQLRALEDRCFRVVNAGPGGSRISALLQRILFRELNWRTWKMNSCPTLTTDPVQISNVKVKPTLVASQAPEIVTTAYSYPKDLNVVQELLQKLFDAVPTYDAHIEDFNDAEDPDNGMEDEYHPRHDSIYCWRARRLLAEKCLGAFSVMHDGDLRKGLKYVAQDADGEFDAPRPWFVLKERPPLPEEVPKVVDDMTPSVPDSTINQMEEVKNVNQEVQKKMSEAASDDTDNKNVEMVVKQENAKCLDSEKITENATNNDVSSEAWIHIMGRPNVAGESDICAFVEKFGVSVLEVRQFAIVKSTKGGPRRPKYDLVRCSREGAELIMSAERHVLPAFPNSPLALTLLSSLDNVDTIEITPKSRAAEDGEESESQINPAKKKRRN